jgi:co-chaperonin GroES (HSP10)
MSEKKRKPDIIIESEDKALPDDSDFAPIARSNRESKRIRKVSPLGMRVLVALHKDSNQTDGGLYLPEGAKQNMAESLLAEVIEVASATDDSTDEEHNVSGIPLGAIVLIPKLAGIKIPWDETLRLVETKEVLAIVNEISIT